MEFIKIKCRKCGYEIEIPEKTSSVICGSCGEINHFNKISALLRGQSSPAVQIRWKDKSADIAIKEKLPAGIRDNAEPENFPDQANENQPFPGDDEDFPEQKGAIKIMTLIFILAPFIAMAVEFLKLPSYAVLIAIAAVVLIVFFLKKRS